MRAFRWPQQTYLLPLALGVEQLLAQWAAAPLLRCRVNPVTLMDSLLPERGVVE
jgi:hypothetical protein